MIGETTAFLQGKHVVVTGGGRGIGAAIAAAFAAAGACVTVMGRKQADLDATVAALPAGKHRAVICDVTDEKSVAAAFAQAETTGGPTDIFIGNAGIAHSAPFAKQSEADLRAMLEVNSIGLWRCIRAVLPGMTTRGWGRIIAVASTAGLKGYPYVSGYVLSKHAAVGLVRALALETARSGVTVNAVCPGYTETDIVREAVANIMRKTGRSEEEARRELTRGNPTGRLVQPEEVAATVLSFCGPDSGALNGQALAVDGGETAG